MATDTEEIKDIDARIAHRSMRVTGDVSVHQDVTLLLEIFAFQLKFLKSLRKLKIKQIFKLIEGTDRISGVFGGSRIFTFSYRLEFLKFMADSLMTDKRIFYYMGSSKKEGGFIWLAVVPTALLSSSTSGESPFSKIEEYIQARVSLVEKSELVLKEIADHLRDILGQELGQERWDKILEMKAGRGLLRSGPVKGWPLVKEMIYTAYTILLPIYPARAHMYKLQKWEGEKARYPKALLKDLVQLFVERFPEDLKDLTEGDIVSCIKYRTEKAD